MKNYIKEQSEKLYAANNADVFKNWFSSIGFSLTDENGNYKTTDTLLKELSEYLYSDEDIVDFKQ